MGTHKPDGYTTVSPYLIVDGASRTIEFVQKVLGAIELRRFAGPAGKVMHAEVRIDDTVVMIADAPDGSQPVRRTCMSTLSMSTRHTRARSRPAQHQYKSRSRSRTPTNAAV